MNKLEMTKEEEDFHYSRLPYMYIALLEYCSEVTGDSCDAIDDHIEKTVVFPFPHLEGEVHLNG